MVLRRDTIAAMAAGFALICAAAAPAQAQQFANARPLPFPFTIFDDMRDDRGARPQAPMMVPDRPIPDQRMIVPEDRPLRHDRAVAPHDDTVAVPAHLRRQIVNYSTAEAPGTIVIDTPNAYLYYVLGGGRAIRYGVGVGREGFTWSGIRSIGRKEEWPDWHPPAEMIARQPYLPRFMTGGPGNPLGARAMYLQGTLYRIHGTSQPETIGQHVSSGCIRMLNEDAIDLYNRVSVGTKVVVLPDSHRAARQQPAAVRRAAPVRIYSDAAPRPAPVRIYSDEPPALVVAEPYSPYGPRPTAEVPDASWAWTRR